jgi:hypothetical protein
MPKRFGSHFRHNVVAYLALFFALGGTAFAAKPLITGADVQDASLTGADVSDDSTLKRVDIDESDLGQVPSAQNADNAANADKLDGKDASELGGGATTFDVAISPPGAADPSYQTVARLDNGVSILGFCFGQDNGQGIGIALELTNLEVLGTTLKVSGLMLRDFDNPRSVLVENHASQPVVAEAPFLTSFHVIARAMPLEADAGSWARIDVTGRSRAQTGSSQCELSGIATPYG